MTLLPCPHCGGNAEASRYDVTCAVCNATINSQAAEADWNRRAPSPAFVAMREALEKSFYCGAWTITQEIEWDSAREKALALAESETTHPNPKP